jgi:membrane-bound lytic murein transglycosylase B
VESSSLRGRRLDPFHDVVPPVVGPALTGGAYARIHDSDGGALDGDPNWDHAVGPMQFIPATWRIWGADGSGDGVADPQNVEDAALAAARYLCAGGRDLSRDADRRAAVRSYNHSDRYVATVLGLYAQAPASAR